jgi:hypothetical protein
MATSDIMKQAVFDARIVQLPPRYAVEKGALSLTNAPYRAISATTSQHTYSINVPSQNVFVDRAIDWSADVFMTFGISTVGIPAIAGQDPIVKFGEDIALCAFPLHELVGTMTATINDTSVVLNTDTVLHEVLRLTDYKKNRLVRHCPTMLDRYKNYGESAGATNSPISGYFEATASDEVPNGAWYDVVFTTQAGSPLVGGTPSAPSTAYQASLGYNVVYGVPVRTIVAPATTEALSYTLYIKFHSSEKLVLSPFIFADSCEWETGLFGINNIQLVCNMKADSFAIARVLRVDAGGNRLRCFSSLPAYNNSASGGAYQNAKVDVQFLTPSLDLPLPAKSVVPYTEFPRYITNVVLNGGASPSTVVQSQTIVLPQIPDSLLIYCKYTNTNQYNAGTTPFNPNTLAGGMDGDFYFPITNINISFDNFSGLLNSHTVEELYQLSAHNGLEMDYNEWIGQAKNGQTGWNIQTVGGFLVIKPGQDFGLQSGQAPSLIGNFTLQFNATVSHPFLSASTNASLYVVAVNSGFFETLAGSSRIIKGVLSEADIISAEPVMEMSRDGLKRMVGNGFFSSLGSMLSKAVDIYTKTKPLVSGLKGALPEGKVKDILGKVGYGMPSGAGMMAGGVASGAGKKSLSQRLM